MIEVKRARGENPQRVVARFIRATKKSGILIETRRRMFRRRPLNEFKKKRSALHRLLKKAEREKAAADFSKF